ncbi:MAG: alpha-L-arabinofuranosidase C-terminal domain-containing protein, partial [Candidatus Brocadiia bacterium]
EDALVVGGMLITLLNNCDRVKVACLAQVVNVIAPIMAPPDGAAWRQTIFHPFAQASAFGRGVALQQAVSCPTYDTAERDAVPVLSSACVRSHDGHGLALFAVNRGLTEALTLTLAARGFELSGVEEWTTMRADALETVNTAHEPNAVAPAAAEGARLEDGRLRVELPPASWNVIRLHC